MALKDTTTTNASTGSGDNVDTSPPAPAQSATVTQAPSPVTEVPVPEAQAGLPAPDAGLEELPEGAEVVGNPDPNDNVTKVAPDSGNHVAPGFSDQHVGIGGTFIMNAKGERVPAYETYLDGTGKKRYRRAV